MPKRKSCLPAAAEPAKLLPSAPNSFIRIYTHVLISLGSHHFPLPLSATENLGISGNSRAILFPYQHKTIWSIQQVFTNNKMAIIIASAHDRSRKSIIKVVINLFRSYWRISGNPEELVGLSWPKSHRCEDARPQIIRREERRPPTRRNPHPYRHHEPLQRPRPSRDRTRCLKSQGKGQTRLDDDFCNNAHLTPADEPNAMGGLSAAPFFFRTSARKCFAVRHPPHCQEANRH